MSGPRKQSRFSAWRERVRERRATPPVERGVLRRWFRSITSSQDGGQDTRLTPAEHRYVQKFISGVLIAVLCFFIFVAFFWENEALRFWLQLLTGNWSPENSKPVGAILFSVSVLIGMILNWLPLIAAFGFSYKFIKPIVDRATIETEKNERAKMNLTKALSVQTATQKQQILARLPDNSEIREMVNSAFAEAATVWKDRLRNMIGENEAEEVFTALEKEIKAEGPAPSL
ncbi:hypothetical protein MKK67_00470 [Methylobacterium sp. J-072]|uniref:hypothetical protein n=1 Tax=Methylobacterium sp. J-072 TaxID=2836651 RepID=UPI001FB877DF|nr:hypothetical protein [Methylobacterium sp. J-072]MCJ2090989.1 hypothetical protein [Methylobacterium sp. J-072]